jgi:O-antigen ligase
VPSINEVFAARFVLVESYDSGETGRFGNQLNAIPMLLSLPLGFGPYQYEMIFSVQPHNTFLDAFANGGWLGGVSYIILVVTNFYMGIRVIFTRSPYQSFAIPLVTTYIFMTLQGLQIDNEHWRHLIWMMGMIWGLFAATQHYKAHGGDGAAVLGGWNIPLKPK